MRKTQNQNKGKTPINRDIERTKQISGSTGKVQGKDQEQKNGTSAPSKTIGRNRQKEGQWIVMDRKKKNNATQKKHGHKDDIFSDKDHELTEIKNPLFDSPLTNHVKERSSTEIGENLENSGNQVLEQNQMANPMEYSTNRGIEGGLSSGKINNDWKIKKITRLVENEDDVAEMGNMSNDHLDMTDEGMTLNKISYQNICMNRGGQEVIHEEEDNNITERD